MYWCVGWNSHACRVVLCESGKFEEKQVIETLQQAFVAYDDRQPFFQVVSKVLCRLNALLITKEEDDEDMLGRTSYSDAGHLTLIMESPSTHYTNWIQLGYAAQKVGIQIDSCLIPSAATGLPVDTAIGVQISELANGKVLGIPQTNPIEMATLISHFLIETHSATSESLDIVSTDSTKEYASYCFCHGKKIQFGYICSFCFSLYCSPPTTCQSCKMEYK